MKRLIWMMTAFVVLLGGSVITDEGRVRYHIFLGDNVEADGSHPQSNGAPLSRQRIGVATTRDGKCARTTRLDPQR